MSVSQHGRAGDRGVRQGGHCDELTRDCRAQNRQSRRKRWRVVRSSVSDRLRDIRNRQLRSALEHVDGKNMRHVPSPATSNNDYWCPCARYPSEDSGLGFGRIAFDEPDRDRSSKRVAVDRDGCFVTPRRQRFSKLPSTGARHRERSTQLLEVARLADEPDHLTDPDAERH
jgi:hypothetical protein